MVVEKKTNLVIFPENCFTGYFLENEKEYKFYMKNSCLDHLSEWLDKLIQSYLSESLQYIVFNGFKKSSKNSDKFF